MGDVWFGHYKPTKTPRFWWLHYLSWPNHITVGVNSNRNRLLLGTLLHSYNRQQLITICQPQMSAEGPRDATPEMNCWDDMRRLNVTRKGAARSLRVYIAAYPQTDCNPPSSNYTNANFINGVRKCMSAQQVINLLVRHSPSCHYESTNIEKLHQLPIWIKLTELWFYVPLNTK